MYLYTADVDEPNLLNFSNPSLVPETALFSFHPLVFLYFILSFYLVPYALYRFVAKKYNWETNPKSIARHWSDTMHAFSYGVILFIFGNYTRAFSWITLVTFYPCLFGYALIAEQPYTKTSLPNIKHWPKGMWIVFIIAVVIILAFAGFHIYFASQLTFPFVIYYICALLIPIFFLVMSVLLIKEVNSNWIRTKYHNLRVQQTLKRRVSSNNNSDALDESGVHDYIKPENHHQQQQQQSNNSTYVIISTSIHNPYNGTINLHIHHWQIFYVLAFFTRFTHPLSQVAAGMVIACYMQGICAYGYDALVNDNT